MPEKSEQIPACCPDCKGGGYTSRTKEKFCPTCKGGGKVTVDPAETQDCPKCEEGWLEPGTHCHSCCGTGKVVKKKS